MPVALFLLMNAVVDPSAVLDKMRATLLKPLSVDFSISRRDVPGKGAGHLVLDRPHRMFFKAKWGKEEFESACTEERTVEISRNRKLFYESGPFDRLYRPSSSFSLLSDYTFPLVLLATDPRSIYQSVKVSAGGSEKIRGTSCTHVSSAGWDAWVADDGRLLKWRFDVAKADGNVSVLTEFSNYKVGGAFPKGLFEPAVPAGYQQNGLPRDVTPLQTGAQFPEKPWVTEAGGPPNFVADKPFLAVAVARDCEVSARAAKALDTLKDEVPIFLFSDDGAVPASLKGLTVVTDRGGRALDRLYAPGTPLFLLVDAKHRVKSIWYGFEPDREEQFIKSVRAALAK